VKKIEANSKNYGILAGWSSVQIDFSFLLSWIRHSNENSEDLLKKGRKIFLIVPLLLLIIGCSRHYEEGAHAPKPPPKTPDSEEGIQDNANVSGLIQIAPELANQVPDDAYIFIVARERATGGPPPYAVKRIKASEFPMAFSLSQSDILAMAGDGLVFADIPEMFLTAKIDQDGKVGDPQPGDMEGACITNPVAAGDSGCEILINRVF